MSERFPTVTYALTDEDQLAFAWDNAVRQAGLTLAWLALIGVIAGVATKAATGLLLVMGAGLLFGLPFFALTWFQTRSAVLAQLRARPLHGSTLTIMARPDGIEMKGAEQVLHAWPLVGKPSLTRSSLTFPVGHATKLLVPRRAFADRASERAFRDALNAGRRAPAPLPEPEDDGPYTYDLTYLSPYDDLVALNRWFMNRQEPPERLRRTVRVLLALAGGSLLLIPFVGYFALVFTLVFAIGAAVSTPYGRPWLVRFRVWQLWRRAGHDEGPIRLRARPDGVVYRGRSLMRGSWATVTEIVDDEAHLFVFNGPASAWIVPKRVLGGPEQVAAFVSDVNAWVAAAAPYTRPPVPKGDAGDVTNPFRAPGVD